MTDKRELLERVKAAHGPDRELDWRIAEHFAIPETWKHSSLWPPFMEGSKFDLSIPVFTGSIDAACAFAEKLLPGEWLGIMARAIEDVKQRATRSFEFDLAALPLAIIAATLTAHTQETTND